jgi:hypothetical protein
MAVQIGASQKFSQFFVSLSEFVVAAPKFSAAFPMKYLAASA